MESTSSGSRPDGVAAWTRPPCAQHSPCPGSDLEQHVLRAGARAQSAVGVLADDVLESSSIYDETTATPSLDLDVADLAYLHPGHPHGLPLAGANRLGVLELDLHHLGRLL